MDGEIPNRWIINQRNEKYLELGFFYREARLIGAVGKGDNEVRKK